MSRDEFVTRSRQELGKRLDRVLSLMRHDFAETPRAASSRPRFFFNADEVPAILSGFEQRLPAEYAQIVSRAEQICAHRFDLLGYKTLDYGPEIDWSLDRVHGKRAPRKPFYKIRYLEFAECGDVKVTWELNRHQHLLTLAKAYRITGQQKFADEIFAQWDDWHRENPYPHGVNWASSLEYAFRALSWQWTYHLLGDAAAQRPGFREQFLRAISVHGRAVERYLSTYFSPNTHLMGEAVALFFIGVLCPELPSAERWKDVGWKITLQEAQRQVRADGLHFEQSLYYHVYAIDFFLHARILAARNGIAIPAEFDATIERMLNALAVLGRTGSVPRIGDDDGGRLFDGQRNRSQHMVDSLAVGAILYKRGDFKAVAGGLREETLWLLGAGAAREFDSIATQAPKQASVAFADSGLYVMNAGDRQIIIDAGPLGSGSGGHGHADGLSICASDVHGPLLVDSGTYEYVGDGSERDQYRGTSAHSTLAIDSQSQPRPRGPFAWSHHPTSVAEKWIIGEHFDFFAGRIEAAEVGGFPPLHRRYVFALKNGFWLVRDVVEGAGEHQLDAYWHVAPEYTPSDGSRFMGRKGSVLEVITPRGSKWSERVIEAGSWSPVYGQAQSSPVLHFSTVASLPTEFVTLFRAGGNASGRGLLKSAGESIYPSGYVYAEGDQQHSIFFAPAGARWSLGDWSSDAEFVYWGYDRKRDSGLLIVCGGCLVSFAGRELVACLGPAPYFEIVRDQGTARVLASASDLIVLRDPGLGALVGPAPAITVPEADSRSAKIQSS